MLFVFGLIGIAAAVFFTVYGEGGTYRKMRSMSSLFICSGLMILVGAGGAASWHIKLNRLRQEEPWLSDAALMTCETSIKGLFFLFSDRLIDLDDPKVIYYYDIDSLRVRHTYGRRGTGRFYVTVSLRDGSTVRCAFRYRGFFNEGGARADAETLCMMLRQRILYIV